MRSARIVVTIYLGACVVSFFTSAGEGYMGKGSVLSLILTLPWSLIVALVFGWALIHDGARSLTIVLVPAAVLNAMLLFKLTKVANRKLRRVG